MSTVGPRRVAVVGGGAVGAAVFHAACRAGHQVTLLERGVVAGAATARGGGVVRCLYDSVELTDAALAGLRHYRDFAGHTGVDVLFNTTGLLCFPRPDREDHARAMIDRMNAAGVPAHWLTEADIVERFPGTRGGPAVWEPWAGCVDQVDATRAWARAGVRLGGRVHTGVEVLDLIRTDDVITGLRTSAGPIEVDVVVLAAGAGTPALLDAWGIAHDLWCQVVQVELFRPAAPLPAHPAFIDQVHDLNGRGAGVEGVYLGHSTGRRVRTGDRVAGLDPAHTALVAGRGRHRFDWLADAEPSGGMIAADCFAPTTTVGVRSAGGIVLAAGYNGGAFKLAPFIAARAVALVSTMSGDRP